MLEMLLTMFCFRAGRRIRIALLLYCVIAAYDIITSGEVRVIWDVHPKLLFYPYLRISSILIYFWEYMNNHTQPVGKQDRIIFPMFSPTFSPSEFFISFEC